MNPSCGSCNKTSENKFFNCPPKMSDGRHFTDYRPRCAVNFPQEFKDAPVNSYEYRQYLIKNAESLMSQNRQQAFRENACGPCVEPFHQGTMLPEQGMVECNGSTCRYVVNDPNGLGVGRKYGDTPQLQMLRQDFEESRKKLNAELAQQSNCCATSQDDQQMYSADPEGIDTVGGRFAVPGGGQPFTGNSRM